MIPDGNPLSRRAWIGVAAGSVAAVVLAKHAWAEGASAPISVDVYRSPTCGCCGKWMDIMRKEGYAVTAHDMEDVNPVKRQHLVPEKLYSCHTALAQGYVFEGHVPPDLVGRVLRERPAMLGLAAPGMPQSAPGMDIGHVKYEVISFTRDGKTAVYAVRS
jgi:hypothetical protein